jgi:hypothetical protein
MTEKPKPKTTDPDATVTIRWKLFRDVMRCVDHKVEITEDGEITIPGPGDLSFMCWIGKTEARSHHEGVSARLTAGETLFCCNDLSFCSAGE